VRDQHIYGLTDHIPHVESQAAPSVPRQEKHSKRS